MGVKSNQNEKLPSIKSSHKFPLKTTQFVLKVSALHHQMSLTPPTLKREKWKTISFADSEAELNIFPIVFKHSLRKENRSAHWLFNSSILWRLSHPYPTHSLSLKRVCTVCRQSSIVLHNRRSRKIENSGKYIQNFKNKSFQLWRAEFKSAQAFIIGGVFSLFIFLLRLFYTFSIHFLYI